MHVLNTIYFLNSSNMPMPCSCVIEGFKRISQHFETLMLDIFWLNFGWTLFLRFDFWLDFWLDFFLEFELLFGLFVGC